MRKTFSILFVLVLLFLATVPALAVDSAKNSFTLARDVRQSSRTEGDFAAIGNDTEVSRGVGGNVYTVGRNVLITDQEKLQNIAVVGANVNVHVKSADNIYVAGADVDVHADEDARGLYLAGASVTLSGNATDAYIAGGMVNIAGTVKENLIIRSNNIVFDPDTTVGGNVTIYSKKQVSLPSSINSSRVTYRSPGVFGRNTGEAGNIRWQATLRRVGVALTISGIVAAVALSLAINAMRGSFFARRAEGIRRNFWKTLLYGFVASIVVPVVAFALLFTVVGVPIGILLLILCAIAFYLSPIMAGLVFGRAAFPHMNRFLSGAIFVLGIWLLMLVPYIGFVVSIFAMIYGVGTIISAVPPRRHVKHTVSTVQVKAT